MWLNIFFRTCSVWDLETPPQSFSCFSGGELMEILYAEFVTISTVTQKQNKDE